MKSESSSGMSSRGGWQDAYPDGLREKEADFVRLRSKAIGAGEPKWNELVGVAVSGGGIRSATFALGFFQGLVKTELFRRIDYLSTVSGGSYFGAFFSALFLRGRLTETNPTIDEVAAVLGAPTSAPNRWLRDNGRYLAPAGGGDILAAAASYLRSLVAIHVVVGMLVLALFLGAILVEGYGLHWLIPQLGSWLDAWDNLWFDTALVAILLCAIPIGWAFWLMPGQSNGSPSLGPWALITGAIALPWMFLGTSPVEVRVLLNVVPGLTSVFAGLALLPEWFRNADPVAARRKARGRLTTWLSWSLTAAGVLLLFAVVYLAGDWLSLRLFAAERQPLRDTLVASMIALAPAAARAVFNRLTSQAEVRLSMPMSLLAGVAAVAAIGTQLVVISTIAHALKYAAADSTFGVAAAFAIVLGSSFVLGQSWAFLNLSTLQAIYAGRLTRAYLGASNRQRYSDPTSRRLSDPVPGDDVDLHAYRPFDSGGPLHLINVTINETVDGETQTEYRDRKGIGLAVGPAGLSAGVRHHALWQDPQPAQRWFAGLRNAGQSVGKFFRGLTGGADGKETSAPLIAASEAESTMPIKCLHPASKDTGLYYMFDGDDAGLSEVEKLPVGAWVGISGAAVSTGLGYRTSVALSLLAGFFNVRLGYWWDSHTNPARRKGTTPTRGLFDIGRLVSRIFPVQSHLLDEWLARFRGPARQRWNLTDGGHFENTAAYELIRRRLPFIIVLDDGEDPEWRFEDLGNLVRKVRIDFGASVELVQPEISKPHGSRLRLDKGGPESAQPHRKTAAPEWINALFHTKPPIVAFADLPPKKGGPLGIPTSKGNATLARITYGDGDQESWMLIVKPTLCGDEPVDVVQYRREHPAFPQEPTFEQFFNEPQWESYRRLGQHVASKLFQAR